MATDSHIEWTDKTWNPVTGCTKVSQGCKHCYAERMAKRLNAMKNPRYVNGFKVTLHPDLLDVPKRWKKGCNIFVNSMSDLFHEKVPFSFIIKVFDTMEKANWHIFQILTKRPQRMIHFTREIYKKVLPNVWLGTSIENDKVLHRLKELKKVKAKMR